MIDPDSGETHFEYSAFDEASRIWDSLHDVAYRRDDLGRAVRKEHTHAGITELTTFEYDLGTGAIGRLTSATSPDGVQTELQYDALGQPISSKWTIGGEVFAIERTYGVDGRPDELRYPEAPGRARFSVKAHYNERGYLDSLLPDAGAQAKPFWAVTARTPDGRLAQSTWGAGPTETRSYNPSTGRLDGLRIDKGAPYGASPLFDVAYTYDAGDLVGRTDAVTGREEAFEYDALDRLKKWTLHGPATRTTEYGYDDLGNLTSVAATAAGQPQAAEQLVYDMAVHPHAAHRRTVGADPEVLYHYDARGRLFEGGGRGITWTDFDLPRTITQGGQTVTFLYDAFGARVKKTRTAPGQPTETTISLGGLYERKTAGDKVDHGFFVHGDDGPVTEVVYHEEEGTEDEHLLGRDGHGSLSLVFAANGDVHERLYYEPFGARVTAEGAPIAGTSSGVPWGFTGHREDDDLGLIDMRGRIYDPVLRRFLSPDPIVHDLLAGQTLNHYSYVWNNPLRYVDPTGLDGEGGVESGGFSAWLSDAAAGLYTAVADLFGPKQTLQKVKPTAQIVPAGPPEASVVTGDIQVDEGSATKSTPSSARESRPVTPRGVHPGLAGMVPVIGAGAAGVNTSLSRLDTVLKGISAAIHGDPYHTLDAALELGQDVAEDAGKPLIDAGRSAVTLPGDVNDLVTANNADEAFDAAGDVLQDLAGIGGGIGLAVGALRPTATAAGEISGGSGSGLKAPFNPSGSMTNCVNGVCAFLNSVKNGGLVTASADVAANSGSIARANSQIAAATGVRISPIFQQSTLNTARARQFFVVYPGRSASAARHVLVGINNGGKTMLYDPQVGTKIFDVSSYGPFVAFPLAF